MKMALLEATSVATRQEQARGNSHGLYPPDSFRGGRTLEELVINSDAVVVADVRAVKMAIRETPIMPKTVVTEYHLDVGEAIKDDGHLAGSDLTVIVSETVSEHLLGRVQ